MPAPEKPADGQARPARAAATQSERVLLDLILRQGSPTRAWLTHATDLTQQSVSRIVDDLARAGLVEIGPAAPNGRGQPSATVALRPAAAYGLGLSVTADGLSLAAMNLRGDVLGERSIAHPSPSPEEAAEATMDFIAAIPELSENRGRVAGLGVGLTGFFVAEGAPVNPRALDAWAFTPFDALLTERVGMPVLVENDGAAAAIGERLFGAGRGLRSFAYLHFSAGFGGGLISEGKPLRGAHGNAGEFGGMLPPDYPPPGLERLRERVAQAGGPTFAGLGPFLADFDPRWPGVEAWLDEAARSLSLVASGVQAVIDPEAIIFGGRLPPVLAEALIGQIGFFNPSRRGRARPEPALLPATSAHDAVAAGAAALPLRRAFFV